MQPGFITANYVAREIGFNMTEGWMQGDRATNAYYQPIDTYGERIGELLALIATQGYTTVDIWTAHLHWSWATPAHIAVLRRELERFGLQAVCYGGRFGENAAEFRQACAVASQAGMRVLAGSTGVLSGDRAAAVQILQEYDCVLAIENHPAEKTPADVLVQIGDGAGGRIGTAVDTGWWGTQGYDAAQAIRELWPHIKSVHLKDVLAAGAHDTCRFGAGVVPIAACVELLKQGGYTGPIAIEHEPNHFDPTDDCIAMRQMTLAWWG
jgi:L-ribulose-5-phosphate 3-epimerase